MTKDTLHELYGDGRAKAKPLIHLPPIYDLPQLRKLSDQRLEMVDRYGFVMRPQTDFLQRLKLYYSGATLNSYARALLDVERLNSCYDGGKGIPYYNITDGHLDKLRKEFLEVRKVGLAHFKRTMRIAGRYWMYAEQERWTQGLYGESTIAQRFKINVPPTGFRDHPVMAGEVIRKVQTLPTHRDFQLIEAAGMTLIKAPSLKRRFRLFCLILKTMAFRRSEAARLDVSMFPSRTQLDEMRRKASEGKRSWTVRIVVKRSKRNGDRVAEFPISLLEEIRNYIDNDRPKDVKGASKTGPLFVSRKTGDQIGDQWITNLFKLAAKKAAKQHTRNFGDFDLAKVRPHHYRHRGITDLLKGYLEEGRDSTEAVLIVMQLVGLRSLDVIMGYVHLAEAATEERNELHRTTAAKHEKRATLDIARIREALQYEGKAR